MCICQKKEVALWQGDCLLCSPAAESNRKWRGHSPIWQEDTSTLPLSRSPRGLFSVISCLTEKRKIRKEVDAHFESLSQWIMDRLVMRPKHPSKVAGAQISLYIYKCVVVALSVCWFDPHNSVGFHRWWTDLLHVVSRKPQLLLPSTVTLPPERAKDMGKDVYRREQDVVL